METPYNDWGEMKMSVLTRHIFQRYPENKTQIWRMMHNNPAFLTLCNDYGKWVEARLFWKKSKAPEAKAKAEEYRYLCNLLAYKVLQILQGNTGCHKTM